MGTLEIVILIVGIVVCIASFVIPVKKEELSAQSREVAEAEIKAMIANELGTVKSKMEGITDETAQYAMEKAERAMERISNEKIMAVSDYSDTVLEEIHKNHQEVVFLYDMLNDKQESVKSTVAETDKSLKDLMEQVKDTEADVTLAQTESAFRPIVVDPASANVLETPKEAPRPRTHEEIEAIFAPLQQQMTRQEAEEETVGSDSASDGAENTPDTTDAASGIAGEDFADEEEVVNPEIAALIANEKQKSSGRSVKGAKSSKAKTTKAKTSRAKAGGSKRKESAGKPASLELDLMNVTSNTGGNSNDRILRMHEAGKSNMAIARELGLGIGEVQLVIDLYQGAGDGL